MKTKNDIAAVVAVYAAKTNSYKAVLILHDGGLDDAGKNLSECFANSIGAYSLVAHGPIEAIGRNLTNTRFAQGFSEKTSLEFEHMDDLIDYAVDNRAPYIYKFRDIWKVKVFGGDWNHGNVFGRSWSSIDQARFDELENPDPPVETPLAVVNPSFEIAAKISLAVIANADAHDPRLVQDAEDQLVALGKFADDILFLELVERFSK